METGKSISEQEIEKYLTHNYADYVKSVVKKTSLETPKSILAQAARELFLLNEAMLKGYEVWADCEKSPRGNLDTGKHWFQIWFLDLDKTGKPIRHHFWALLFMDKNRDNSCFKWGFSSGAIGMSRLLDSTEIVFRILRKLGGCYTQL